MKFNHKSKLGAWTVDNIGYRYLECNRFLFISDWWYDIYILQKPIFTSLIKSFKKYKLRRD